MPDADKNIWKMEKQKMLFLTILAIAAITAVVVISVFGMRMMKTMAEEMLEEFR